MMQYPYRAAISYLTPKQREALDLFLAEKPEYGTMYINSKGEKRQVTRVSLPIGCVTPDTVFVEIKGEMRYYTDGACEPDGYAVVSWRSADGKEWKRCNSEEWFEWLGTDYKTEPVPEARPSEDILRERKLAQSKANMMLRRQRAEQELARLDSIQPEKKEKVGVRKTQ